MAFNPFDVFRRNQKILFACLTVVVMFMFVLSFGQGDFFSQFPQWLARNRGGTGPVMAEIDGSRVYASELEQTRADRVLANQYMFAAAVRGVEALTTSVREGLSQASAENRPVFEAVLQAPEQLRQINALAQNPNPFFQQFAQQQRQQVAQTFARVQAVLTAPSPKPDDLRLAQAASLMASLNDLVGSSRRAHYFVNQPNESNKDVMDFLLWRRKADRLGVRLDDRAVVKLANDEFFGKLSDADWRAAEDSVRDKRGYSPAELRRALAEEFRVRAAQAAVLGTQTLRADGQPADAPYDYFKYYQEQTNSARYGLVTVPVENFIPRVKGQPTESELLAIFQKGRNVEPDPRLPGYGLKEPRRVKLGFVELTGDEGYFKTRATAAVAAAEAALAAGSPAANVTAALSGPAVLAGAEGPLQRQYARYKQEHARQVSNGWTSPTPFGGGRPLDTHVLEPVNLAALIAAFAAPGGPLTAPAVLVADGFASDRIAKIESVLPGMIAPTGPGGSALAVVLGAAGGYGAFVQPLPLAAVRGLLLDRAREEEAKRAAADDVLALVTDLGKPGVKPEDAKARLEAFAKERGLTVKGSQDLRDRFDLGSDPGLKPLEARFQADTAAQAGVSGGYVDPSEFGARFFLEAGPGGGPARPAAGLFKPQVFPEGALFRQPAALPAFVVWRTQDVPAEAPRTLDDKARPEVGQKLAARDKAVLVWKEQKARELARKEAEELAKRAGAFGPSSVEIEMKLRDEAAKLAGQFDSPEAKARVQYHEIDRVAPLVNEVSFLPGRGGVAPFQLGPSAFIPYPSQEIYDTLLANRDKPLGTAAVAADRPGDRLYVIVLEQKTVNSPDVFGLTVYGPTAQMPTNELGFVVGRAHRETVRQENRDRAVSLLKAEFRYEKESDELAKRSDLFGD